MAAAPSIAKVSLKLIVDPKGRRVLFAEAGKDFVDFLLNLLHLPVGTAVQLLTEQQTSMLMPGSLGNLYKSTQNMSETYFFQSSQTKDSLLNPKLPFSAAQVPLLPLEGGNTSSSANKKCYTCPVISGSYGQSHPYFSDDERAICPCCGTSLSREIQYVAAANEVGEVGEGGLVKGEVSYMVRDDLVVTPMSTSSWIDMLKKFNVTGAYALVEKVVDFGRPEGLKLLKASWNTNQVLTSVFMEMCSL